MIVQDRFAEIKPSTVKAEAIFAVSEEGLAIILDILRNQLYSNKELAVVREYSCNGFDAMVEAGKKDQPFLVTLPTDSEPVFKVRDYGKGLSLEEVREIFICYGASTKRLSNDLIGQKGIGAKSGFAYGDSFMVISYQGGQKSSYVAYLDASMIGKMTLLSEDSTEEPDGLEVIVSVREGDIDKFRNEAARFFRYWRVKPTFEGFQPIFIEEKFLFEGEKKDWLIPAKENQYSSSSSPVVIMGGVAYVLDDRSIDWSGCDSSLRVLLRCGVRMWVDIGSIEISASREALQYTPITQKTIIDRLAAIREELSDIVNGQLKACASLYSAKVLYNKIFDLASPMYPLRELFSGQLTFKGKPVTSNFWEGHNAATIGAVCRKYVRASGRRSRAYSEGESYRFYADEHVLYILNDLGTDKGILGRLASLVESTSNVHGRKYSYVFVFSVKDTSIWDEWREERDFDAPLVLLSSLPKVKLSEVYPSGSRGNSYFNPKHAAKVFRWEDAGSFSNKDRADHWEEMDVDYNEEEGVYVVINSFCYLDEHGRELHPCQLASLCKTVEAAGIEWPEIIGIKVGKIGASGYPKRMISLKTYLTREIQKKIEEMPNFNQSVANYGEIASLTNRYNYSHVMIGRLMDLAGEKYHFLVDSSPISEFLRHYIAMNHLSAEAASLNSLAKRFNISSSQAPVAAAFDLRKEWENLKKVYPLLFMIESTVFSFNWIDANVNHIGNYIASIDRALSMHKNAGDTAEEGAGI